MIKAPNVLIVAGAGQDVGKSSLVIQLIEKFSKHQQVVAVKISQHLHPIGPGYDIIVKTDHYCILRDTGVDLKKDSGKFYKAGAVESIYMQCDKIYMSLVVPMLLDIIAGRLAIIESGGLRQYIHPSLFLYVTRNEKTQKDNFKELADCIIDNFDYTRLNISILNKQWKLTNVTSQVIPNTST